MSVWQTYVSDMSDSRSSIRASISTSYLSPIKTSMLNMRGEDTPMARFLAEAPLSPLPVSTPREPRAMSEATTPREPRAMSNAKATGFLGYVLPYDQMSTPRKPRAISNAKARTPKKRYTDRERYIRSESPSPPSPRAKNRTSERVSSGTDSKKNSSSHYSSSLVILTSRKRTSEHLSPSPATKRRASQEYTPTPIPRARNDHWSPGSSRVSSPVRSPLRIVPVLAPAANWYPHLQSSSAAPSPETPRPRVATPSPTAAKKYPSLLSVTVSKLDDETEKKKICYNCGKKGHLFMDCVLGCGKCGKDGHRTIDCSVVRLHAIDVVKKENVKEAVR